MIQVWLTVADALTDILDHSVPHRLLEKATGQVVASKQRMHCDDFQAFTRQCALAKTSYDPVYMASVLLDSAVLKQKLPQNADIEESTLTVSSPMSQDRPSFLSAGQLGAEHAREIFGQRLIKEVSNRQCLVGTFIDRTMPKRKGERACHPSAAPAMEKGSQRARQQSL